MGGGNQLRASAMKPFRNDNALNFPAKRRMLELQTSLSA
jgi:hypothetical protein